MLPTPTTDFIEVSDTLGQAWAVGTGESLSQYVAWSSQAGIFSLLAQGRLFPNEICEKTKLAPRGVNALVPVLLALKLLVRDPDGSLALSTTASEYLLPESPYYVGQGLFIGREVPLPQGYTQPTPPSAGPKKVWDTSLRLHIQHSRNFAPSVIAARSGEFADRTNVVDIGGGSGVIAIPLVLDNPNINVTLVDQADTVSAATEFLAKYHVQDRIKLLSMNVLEEDWASFTGCDAVFFGNFFHFLDDKTCQMLCEKAFRILPSGGKLFLHEVLFHESMQGPLLAALWNAIMVGYTEGRQRTASELFKLASAAGFKRCRITPTALSFSLITAEK